MAISMDFLSNPVIISVITPLFLVVVFIYIFNKKQDDGNGKKTKKYHRIGGTVFNMLINIKRLHHYIAHLAAKYKTYRMINPIHGEVYTSDPANVEYILKTNFKNYGKGKYFYDIMKDLLGDGIFTVDGDQWREQRKDLFMKGTIDSIFKVAFGIDLDSMSLTAFFLKIQLTPSYRCGMKPKC